MKIYAIKDEQVGAFNRPFYDHNHVGAKRNVTSAIAETHLGKFPEAFNLYHLGEFDENKGTFKSPGNPELVCSVLQLIEEQTNRNGVAEGMKNAISKAPSN